MSIVKHTEELKDFYKLYRPKDAPKDARKAAGSGNPEARDVDLEKLRELTQNKEGVPQEMIAIIKTPVAGGGEDKYAGRAYTLASDKNEYSLLFCPPGKYYWGVGTDKDNGVITKITELASLMSVNGIDYKLDDV